MVKYKNKHTGQPYECSEKKWKALQDNKLLSDHFIRTSSAKVPDPPRAKPPKETAKE